MNLCLEKQTQKQKDFLSYVFVPLLPKPHKEVNHRIMEAVIFTGIQASGKSSYYRQFLFNTHIRINLDMLKTRHRESLLLRACLEMDQPFVIDNTNPTKKDRQRYIHLAKSKGFVIIGYYFQSKLQDCISRNHNRTGKEQIPEKGIKATHSKLEIPDYEEGFAKLYYVSIIDNTFKVEEWQNEV